MAAQHYGADAIVHLGDSCQSLPGVIPTFFVYPRKEFDIERLKPVPDGVSSSSSSNSGVLICGTEYGHLEEQILKKFGLRYVARLHEEALTTVRTLKFPWYIISPTWQRLLTKKYPTVCGRTIVDIIEKQYHNLPSNPIFWFVGDPDGPLGRRLLLRWGDEGYVYHCNHLLDKEEYAVRIVGDDLLAKRYGAVEAARNGETYGLICGVAAIDGVTEVCDRLEIILRKKGKKSVRLLLGKINIAKLGNLPDIDVFVLISCPHHEVLSTTKLSNKPIVIPFDIEIAMDVREWTTEYKIDLPELLNDPIDWSQFDEDDELPTDIVSWQEGLVENRLRTWVGLDSEISKEPSKVIQGQHGIASEYDKDKNMDKENIQNNQL